MGLGLQKGAGGDIGVQHRHTARLQAVDDRRLFMGNALDAVKGLQMRRGHGGHHHHIRPRHMRQGRNLARMVHANFDHREIRLTRQPRQRQGHAPMVVIARLGGMDPALPAQDHSQHLFGRGFANRSGHPHHPRPRARPRRPAQILQRLQHIRHDEKRSARGKPVRNPRHQSRRRPFFQSLGHKIMPIAHIFQRHEQIPRLQGARVNRHAPRRPRRSCPAPGRRHRLV